MKLATFYMGQSAVLNGTAGIVWQPLLFMSEEAAKAFAVFLADAKMQGLKSGNPRAATLNLGIPGMPPISLAAEFCYTLQDAEPVKAQAAIVRPGAAPGQASSPLVIP